MAVKLQLVAVDYLLYVVVCFVAGVSKRPKMKDFALFGWWLANKKSYCMSHYLLQYCTVEW